MIKFNKLNIIIVACIFFVPQFKSKAVGQTKKRIAVLNINSNRELKLYAEAVRDIIEVQLYRTGRFKIIERKQIKIILNEQNFFKQKQGTEKAVKIGRVLSVDTIVIGSITRIKKYLITIKFIDVKNGNIKYTDSEYADTEDHIEGTVHKLVKRSIEEIVPIPFGYYARGLVPGWAQFHNRRYVKGGLFLSGFIISGVLAGYFHYDYYEKSDAYDRLNSWDSPATFDKKYNDSQNAFITRNIAIGLCAGIYVANIIDVLFFSKYEDDKEVQSSNYNNLLNINIVNTGDEANEFEVRASFNIRF